MTSGRGRRLLELSAAYAGLLLLGALSNHVRWPLPDNLLILLSYAVQVLAVCLLVKAGGETLRDIGFALPSPAGLLGGVALGLAIYLAQVLPPVLLGLDVGSYGDEVDWGAAGLRFLFLLVTVGLGEELVFRGYFLRRLEQVTRSRAAAVALNCVLFYGVHMAAMLQFHWTHFYSTCITTLFCSLYFYLSKRRSVLPLAVAHALLDTLFGPTGFAIWNRLTG